MVVLLLGVVVVVVVVDGVLRPKPRRRMMRVPSDGREVVVALVTTTPLAVDSMRIGATVDEAVVVDVRDVAFAVVGVTTGTFVPRPGMTTGAVTLFGEVTFVMLPAGVTVVAVVAVGVVTVAPLAIGSIA